MNHNHETFPGPLPSDATDVTAHVGAGEVVSAETLAGKLRQRATEGVSKGGHRAATAQRSSTTDRDERVPVQATRSDSLDEEYQPEWQNELIDGHRASRLPYNGEYTVEEFDFPLASGQDTFHESLLTAIREGRFKRTRNQ